MYVGIFTSFLQVHKSTSNSTAHFLTHPLLLKSEKSSAKLGHKSKFRPFVGRQWYISKDFRFSKESSLVEFLKGHLTKLYSSYVFLKEITKILAKSQNSLVFFILPLIYLKNPLHWMKPLNFQSLFSHGPAYFFCEIELLKKQASC